MRLDKSQATQNGALQPAPKAFGVVEKSRVDGGYRPHVAELEPSLEI